MYFTCAHLFASSIMPFLTPVPHPLPWTQRATSSILTAAMHALAVLYCLPIWCLLKDNTPLYANYFSTKTSIFFFFFFTCTIELVTKLPECRIHSIFFH